MRDHACGFERPDEMVLVRQHKDAFDVEPGSIVRPSRRGQQRFCSAGAQALDDPQHSHRHTVKLTDRA